MATGEEKDRFEKRQKERDDWERKVNTARVKREHIYLETARADLEYALTRAEKTRFEKRYWQSQAASLGQHDEILNKVLKETVSMRELLAKLVKEAIVIDRRKDG